MRKRALNLFLLFVIIFNILTMRPINVQAVDRVVKVGMYEFKNYHFKDQYGSISGYEEDYLKKISEIQGIKYEYVNVNSWSEALEMLYEGKIDMLSPCEITDERLNKYIFSTLPIGKTCGAVITLKNNKRYTYEDFEQFDNMVFGIEKGVIYNESFYEYAKENGFKTNIKLFDNHEQLVKSLNEGNVDAIISNITRTEDNMKLLGRFSANSFYFMFNKNDKSLQDEIDTALYKIETDFPNFQNELAAKYFPIYESQTLTKDEIEYASSIRTLNIGCLNDLDPISYLDHESGEVKGITRDVLDKVSLNSGLKFNYVPLPNGSISYDFLRKNNIDLVACTEYNSQNQSLDGIKLSNPYLESQKVMVGKSGFKFDKDSAMRISIVSGSQTIKERILKTYPNCKIINYNSIEEAMDSVLNGKSDLVMENQYAVHICLENPKYEKLEVVPTEGIEDRLSLGIILYQDKAGVEDKTLSDPRLISIINKSISSIKDSENAQIIINHTTERAYKYTFKDFLYKYRYGIAAAIFVFLQIILLIIYILKIKKRNMLMIVENENKLRNITNNINGGVVVLMPQKELKIIYANEGFLELVQFSKSDYPMIDGEDYLMYVHPDDVHILEKLLKEKDANQGQISVSLRIKRKDGSYIPAKFNGTLAESYSGEIKLYCVIMDISKEVDMITQMKIEEKKHHLIFEKSDEIMYEIDIKDRKMIISDEFKRKFGWTMSEEYESNDIDKIISDYQVYEDDKKVLKDMLEKSITSYKDSECIIRIMKADGNYRWCKIVQYTMYIDGDDVVSILGRITDINDEIEEKHRMKELAEIDMLTGVYKKEIFKQKCEEYLRESSEKCAIVFIDLDNFKKVNDLIGHMTGDNAIKDAAQKIAQLLGSNNIVSRFGGDEFCALIKNISDINMLKSILETLVERMRQTYYGEKHSVSISSSIGAVYVDNEIREYEILIKNADKAVYYSKENGKDRFTIYDDNIKLDGYAGRKE